MRFTALVLLAAVAAACRDAGAPPRNRVEPGEEPLETAVLPEEEVQTLEPEPRPRMAAQGRPWFLGESLGRPRRAGSPRHGNRRGTRSGEGR